MFSETFPQVSPEKKKFLLYSSVYYATLLYFPNGLFTHTNNKGGKKCKDFERR